MSEVIKFFLNKILSSTNSSASAVDTDISASEQQILKKIKRRV